MFHDPATGLRRNHAVDWGRNKSMHTTIHRKRQGERYQAEQGALTFFWPNRR
jgi:hypothetical protein